MRNQNTGELIISHKTTEVLNLDPAILLLEFYLKDKPLTIFIAIAAKYWKVLKSPSIKNNGLN